MSCTQPLSTDAKNYLYDYYGALNEMIFKMEGAELTGSLSRDFIVQMIPHHECAIAMSENILRYTRCMPVRKIAENIISEQTASIENMQKALPRCSDTANAESDVRIYEQRFKQITDKMFTSMRRAPETDNLNFNFIKEMIPHHEGAVAMSRNILRFPICVELKPIINAIIVSQEAGICRMKRLLNCGV